MAEKKKPRKVKRRPPPWPQYNPGPWRAGPDNRPPIVDVNGDGVGPGPGDAWEHTRQLTFLTVPMFELLHQLREDLEPLLLLVRQHEPRYPTPASFLQVNELVGDYLLACQQATRDREAKEAKELQLRQEDDDATPEAQAPAPAKKRGRKAKEPPGTVSCVESPDLVLARRREEGLARRRADIATLGLVVGSKVHLPGRGAGVLTAVTDDGFCAVRFANNCTLSGVEPACFLPPTEVA